VEFRNTARTAILTPLEYPDYSVNYFGFTISCPHRWATTPYRQEWEWGGQQPSS